MKNCSSTALNPTVLEETVVMTDVVETHAVFALHLKPVLTEFVLELPPLTVLEDSVDLTEPEEVVVHAQLDKDAELDNVNATMTVTKETVVMQSNPMVPTSVSAPKDLVEPALLDSLVEALEDVQLKHPVTF